MAELLIDRDDRVMPGLGSEATAVFSPCRTYRYALTRVWDTALPATVFVMLNPSTADAFQLDPTVRRCIGFAHTWKTGGLIVLNIFALRSTDPKALYRHDDPAGPDTDQVIAGVITRQPVGPVIAAWGQHGVLHGRGDQVAAQLRGHGVAPLCLGLTAAGLPRHPLYVRGDTTPRDYPGPVTR